MDPPKRRPLNQLPFSLEHEGMSKSEQLHFEAMRKIGFLTFYDCRGCEVCGVEIPLVKRFCSLACESKAKKGDSNA